MVGGWGNLIAQKNPNCLDQEKFFFNRVFLLFLLEARAPHVYL
jgi:hypothetical protein